MADRHDDAVESANADATEWADEPIRIEAYDPTWPAQFESERKALLEAIGDQITGGVHHVGSTAVPGLDAKPIIDILVGVQDLPGSRACFGDLQRLGYLYAPYRADEIALVLQATPEPQDSPPASGADQLIAISRGARRP